MSAAAFNVIWHIEIDGITYGGPDLVWDDFFGLSGHSKAECLDCYGTPDATAYELTEYARHEWALGDEDVATLRETILQLLEDAAATIARDEEEAREGR